MQCPFWLIQVFRIIFFKSVKIYIKLSGIPNSLFTEMIWSYVCGQTVRTWTILYSRRNERPRNSTRGSSAHSRTSKSCGGPAGDDLAHSKPNVHHFNVGWHFIWWYMETPLVRIYPVLWSLVLSHDDQENEECSTTEHGTGILLCQCPSFWISVRPSQILV